MNLYKGKLKQKWEQINAVKEAVHKADEFVEQKEEIEKMKDESEKAKDEKVNPYSGTYKMYRNLNPAPKAKGNPAQIIDPANHDVPDKFVFPNPNK